MGILKEFGQEGKREGRKRIMVMMKSWLRVRIEVVSENWIRRRRGEWEEDGPNGGVSYAVGRR